MVKQSLPKTVKFQDWECIVEKNEYIRGGIALCLVDAHDGEPVATATVFLDGIPLDKNEVIIKDYSENEGMLDAMLKQGVVKLTGKTVNTVIGLVPICEVLI